MLAEFTLLAPRLVATPLITAALALGVWAPTGHPSISRFAPARCARSDANGSVESSHEERDGQNARWRAHWSRGDCSVDLRATGDVKFNADFTDIASLGGNGSLEITETQGGSIRRMTVKADAAGRLGRTWTVNGRNETWNDEARRWLAELLVELDRVTAVGVDYRFPSLCGKGGVNAIIDEVRVMGSDYPRSVYLRRLVASATLTDGDYQRVVTIVARDMSLDYERSRILRAIAERSSLDNAAMRQSYLDAIGRMSSDYERSRVLQTIVTKSPMSRDAGREAVRAAAAFSSDYERSRVLLAAIENKALQSDDAIPILETVTKSQSDYEKGRVLLAVAARWTLTGDTRKAYLRAADTIHSDYENRRVLSALVTQQAR